MSLLLKCLRKRNFPDILKSTGIVYEIFTYLIYTVFRNGRVVTERVDPLLRSLEKNAKKELGQYPAILTSRLVNNAYKQT